MSSVSISSAKSVYGGATEEETLRNMAKHGYRRIYKYANDYGDKRTHTDYKLIRSAGDPQERALLESSYVHNVVLVYDDGPLRRTNMANYPPISRANPLDQVLAVSRELPIILQDESRRQAMLQWWHAFVAEMPQMNFHHDRYGEADTKSRVWGSLGAVIYYLLNPTHHSFMNYCPEAIRCYEEAARCDPDSTSSYFKNCVRDLKYYEPKTPRGSEEVK